VRWTAFKSEKQRAEGRERSVTGTDPTCAGPIQKPPVRPSVTRAWKSASEPGDRAGRVASSTLLFFTHPPFFRATVRVGIDEQNTHEGVANGGRRGSRSSSLEAEVGRYSSPLVLCENRHSRPIQPSHFPAEPLLTSDPPCLVSYPSIVVGGAVHSARTPMTSPWTGILVRCPPTDRSVDSRSFPSLTRGLWSRAGSPRCWSSAMMSL